MSAKCAAVLVVVFGCAGEPAADSPPVVPCPPTFVATKAAPAAPVAQIAPKNPITDELTASAIAQLKGCWRMHGGERWMFRPSGAHGLEVVRELGDEPYAARARIPRPVHYDPTSNSYGFGAAGRIHSLLIIFELHQSTLKAWFYSSHRPGSYGWTGGIETLKRCG